MKLRKKEFNNKKDNVYLENQIKRDLNLVVLKKIPGSNLYIELFNKGYLKNKNKNKKEDLKIEFSQHKLNFNQNIKKVKKEVNSYRINGVLKSVMYIILINVLIRRLVN